MKMKCFLTAALLALSMSLSAQVQVFSHPDIGHGAICRAKSLFLMEAGEECDVWNIVNYKKTGNKETFNLTPKNASCSYSCVLILNGEDIQEMTLNSKQNGKKTLKVKMVKDDEYLIHYYKEECGYKTEPMDVGGGRTPSAGSMREDGVKGAADQVGDAAKKAFGKVKGLFKKKDKK